MARRKVSQKPMPATIAEGKSVKLILPPEVHRLLRLCAALAGKSMSAYAQDAIAALVKREAAQQGIMTALKRRERERES
jgi:hypothetical protein